MIDNDLYTPDRLEQLLSPRCEFRASGDLKDKIVKQAARKQGSRLRRYLPWAAAAASLAAVAVVGLQLMTSQPQPAPAQVPQATAPVAPVEPVVAEATISQDTPAPALVAEAPKPRRKAARKAAEKPVEVDTVAPSQPLVHDDELYACAAETYTLRPMTPSEEEALRRQREANREYLEYMQQEIASAQQFIKNHKL